MICERCKKNEASIHLSEIIKDMKSEIHLCEACANEVGLNAKISNFSLSIPDMLTVLNADEITAHNDDKFCTNCGSEVAEGMAFCTSCGQKQE